MRRRCNARRTWSVCCSGLITLAATAATSQAEAVYSYQIEEVALPAAMVPEISGVAFAPEGELVVVNRRGEVWINDAPPSGRWHRFAFGLHEPLGVLAVSKREILVTQRPELTRLTDSTGDGRADRYETVNDDWWVTDNWHEFTFGLRQDAEGNYLLATGLPDLAGPINELHPREPLNLEKVHQEKKPSPGRYEGWALKVVPDGRLTPVASGFRAAAGVGLSPDGDWFITDQQGDYIATSTLVHVQPGRFYGHPASFKWRDDYQGPVKDLQSLASLRSPEAVALPHGALGGSPGEPVWDTTGGRFGPFEGQVFIGDFTKLISRVYLEKVAGEFQGAAFPFIRDAVGLEAIQANSGKDNLTIPAGGEGLKHFRDVPPRAGTPLRPGNMRMAFAPDGSLYVGQTTRGWGQGDGLQRIVWSGREPVEMKTMELTSEGFRLTFTAPMNRDQLADRKTWRVSRFRYLYLPAGSPRVDEQRCEIAFLRPAEDGRSMEMGIGDLQPGFIYEVEPEGLESAEGKPLENPLVFYTLNRTLDGRVFEGPLSEPIIREAAVADSGPDAEAGRQIYATFCVTCHQPDGRGGGLPGAPQLAAANFRLRGPDAPLSKPDEDLLKIITNGPEGKPMPPFGGVLKPGQIRDVLAYLRAAFGGEDSPGE
jgi:mono/diheme cytochrome c family protein